MSNMTLRLDEETHREVRAHPEIKWSEVARQAIRQKIRELHILDEVLREQGLDQEDADELARRIKRRVAERFDADRR